MCTELHTSTKVLAFLIAASSGLEDLPFPFVSATLPAVCSKKALERHCCQYCLVQLQAQTLWRKICSRHLLKDPFHLEHMAPPPWNSQSREHRGESTRFPRWMQSLSSRQSTNGSFTRLSTHDEICIPKLCRDQCRCNVNKPGDVNDVKHVSVYVKLFSVINYLLSPPLDSRG